MPQIVRRYKRKQPIAEINLVPFIDVMLVLLIVFMITTPLLTQGVKVSLPKAATKSIKTKITPLILTVDKRGMFYLNIAKNPKKPITIRTLKYLAHNKLTTTNSKKRFVLVRADKGVKYGKVVEAMSILQQAGAKNIGLITKKLAM